MSWRTRGARDADVYRTVSRLAASVDDLLADYLGVRALRAFGTDAGARNLLDGVYRHTLVEIRDWIAELVDVLADPLAALGKRGLPTSGEVGLPVSLTLTAAPQLVELSRCLRRHRCRSPRQTRPRRHSAWPHHESIRPAV